MNPVYWKIDLYIYIYIYVCIYAYISPMTIKHIRLNCVDFMALGHQFDDANSMHELFSKVKQQHILVFVRTPGAYPLI